MADGTAMLGILWEWGPIWSAIHRKATKYRPLWRLVGLESGSRGCLVKCSCYVPGRPFWHYK